MSQKPIAVILGGGYTAIMRSAREFWRRRGGLNALLLPASAIFSAASAARRFAYRAKILRREKIAAPVIVVGGITAGGGGKTPLTIALAEMLKNRGRFPGVVSRGYGGGGESLPQMVSENSDPARVGDEPVLIRMRAGIPVCVGKNRAAAARHLLHNSAIDCIISDDGLQHYSLARDAEIAAIDADYGFGNGWLLPAGPLRENPRRLAQCDAIVMTESAAASSAKNIAASKIPDDFPSQKIFRARWEIGECHSLRSPEIKFSPADFIGKRIVAIAGIASPERFFAAVRAAGFALAETYAFADHHPFRSPDLDFPRADFILMTEKDAVKCRRFADARYAFFSSYLRVGEDLESVLFAKIKSQR